MKLKDLETEERNDLENELEAQSIRLGMDSYDSPTDTITKLKDLIGVCSDCKYLDYARMEFGDVYASCDIFNKRLSGQNRVVECNKYSKRGQMSLQEMYTIAHLIDVDKGRPFVKGFITDDPKFRSKK